MPQEICRACGRFFESNGKTYCDPCYGKDKEEYTLVREYVLEHQGVSALIAANATGVPLKSIMRFVKEGRIGTSDAAGKLSVSAYLDKGLEQRLDNDEKSQRSQQLSIAYELKRQLKEGMQIKASRKDL